MNLFPYCLIPRNLYKQSSKWNITVILGNFNVECQIFVESFGATIASKVNWIENIVFVLIKYEKNKFTSNTKYTQSA